MSQSNLAKFDSDQQVQWCRKSTLGTSERSFPPQEQVSNGGAQNPRTQKTQNVRHRKD